MAHEVRAVAFLLVGAVQLGGAFGSASAEVDQLTETSMIVDIQVEVATSATAVVAHLAFDDDRQLTLPLLDRGGGVFGTRTELEPKNYFVVFEALGTPSSISQPTSLTDLGADLDQPFVATMPEDSADEVGLSRETQRIGWLALALAAGSLSALAFWALGDRKAGDEGPDTAAEPPPGEE